MIRNVGKVSTLGHQGVSMKVNSLMTFDMGMGNYGGQMVPTTKVIGLEVCKKAKANT